MRSEYQLVNSFLGRRSMYAAILQSRVSAEFTVTTFAVVRIALLYNYLFLAFSSSLWRPYPLCLSLAIECVENATFSASASTCVNTCRNPNAVENCQDDDVGPGCECLPGHFLNDDKQCIRLQDCGCFDDIGVRYDVGCSILDSLS